MDKKHQMGLLLGAVRDYQDGLMSLGMLINKVEGILELFQDMVVKDDFFDTLLALEEVYARVRTGDLDFERDGKPVVDRAIREMLIKVETSLALSA